MKSHFSSLVIMLWMLLSGATSQAAELISLTPFGLSANRIDIIFVSEGYTATEESLFDDHVELVSNGFFQYQPFSAYETHFKLYSLFEPSNESGADHPSSGIFVDTAFNAHYDCNNRAELICFDNNAVNLLVSDVAGAAQRDIVVLLVNDPQYGGSGGFPAAVSTAPSSIQLIAHELGHSFGGLADEYETPFPALNPCNGNVFEPAALNVTSSALSWPSVSSQLKWNRASPGTRISPWFNQFSPAHLAGTTNVAPNQPGLYEGAFYCNQDYYRPTYNSLMRSPGPSFDVINEEILVRRIHDFVSPIESFSPTGAMVDFSQAGSQQEFSVQTLSGDGGISVIEWKLDGLPIGDQSTQLVDASSLLPGNHTLEVSVTETTTRVRRDLLGQMTASHEWVLSVFP